MRSDFCFSFVDYTARVCEMESADGCCDVADV